MERIMITLPKELLHTVDATVKRLHWNRSQLVRQALSDFVHRIKQQEFETLLADGYREMAGANAELVKESLLLQAAATESEWKWDE
ncbi:ribbon-helix-helix protein, CopG family [Candidatus Poribacteria bacterium]|nr:ribbon-helix-helix protein, CopG family [Candidatus Poribacteria bacterium]